jgi:hypothetical protein
MDKDNEYAGKQESRPVDVKVSETQREAGCWIPRRASRQRSPHFFAIISLEPR